MNKLQIFLIVIVVAFLAFLGFRYYQEQKEILPPVEEPKVVVDNVPTEELPQRFPANFPIEKNVPVNANYTAQAEGAFQSTRQFISTKSVAENFKIYNDFLKKDGWTIQAVLDQENIKSIFAQKSERYSVTVTINKSDSTSEVTVDISFTYR